MLHDQHLCFLYRAWSNCWLEGGVSGLKAFGNSNLPRTYEKPLWSGEYPSLRDECFLNTSSRDVYGSWNTEKYWIGMLYHWICWEKSLRHCSPYCRQKTWFLTVQRHKCFLPIGGWYKVEISDIKQTYHTQKNRVISFCCFGRGTFRTFSGGLTKKVWWRSIWHPGHLTLSLEISNTL